MTQPRIRITNPLSKGDKGDTGEQGPKGDTGSISDSSYGSFYDVQTQALTQQQESTGFPVLIRSIDTDATKGFTVIDNSKMKAANAGVYNFAFSFQFHNTGGGGSGTTVEIWLRKNGTNVDYSNTQLSLNSNNGKTFAAWNFVEPLNAGGYFELKWSATDSAIRLVTNGTQTNPTRPAVPSVIVTITQV